MPIFLRSRLFLDFSDPGYYQANFEELVRNIYEKPKSSKPEPGAAPAYITGDGDATTQTPPPATYRPSGNPGNTSGASHTNGDLVERLLSKLKKESIRNLRRVLDSLDSLLAEEDLKDTVLNLYGQYNDLQKSQGMLTMEQQQMMTNRIRHHLLSILGQIELEDLNVEKVRAYLQE